MCKQYIVLCCIGRRTDFMCKATALNGFGAGLSGNIRPGKIEDGAVNAVRLSLLDKGGETGTWTRRNDETGEITTEAW